MKTQARPNNPTSAREPDKDRPAPRPKQVPAARTAAARTARASAPQEKDNARAWVFARLRDGQRVEWRALAAEFGRGETWSRTRIREAEQAFTRFAKATAHAPSADRPELHLVPVGALE